MNAPDHPRRARIVAIAAAGLAVGMAAWVGGAKAWLIALEVLAFIGIAFAVLSSSSPPKDNGQDEPTP